MSERGRKRLQESMSALEPVEGLSPSGEQIAARDRIIAAKETEIAELKASWDERNNSLNRIIDQRDAARREVEELRTALSRTVGNAERLLKGVPVRDWEETVAEARRALEREEESRCAFPECGEPESRNRHRNEGCRHRPVLLCHPFVPGFSASPGAGT